MDGGTLTEGPAAEESDTCSLSRVDAAWLDVEAAVAGGAVLPGWWAYLRCAAVKLRWM